jgi:dipeptidyl aminopeptidase/acylaminoacyl peptidase
VLTFLALVGGAAAIWLVRRGVHALILRGLRAPRVPHRTGPADFGLNAREVQIPAVNGKSLFGWFVAQPSKSRSPAVVLMHGWGSNASEMLPAASPLQAAGFSVLLVDARCHGKSGDETFTSLPRFSEDIEASLDWLHLQPEVDSDRLALIGHSVGAGAALLSATRRKDLRAVVCLAAFAHPQEVMRRWLQQVHLPHLGLGWYVLRHVQQVIGFKFEDIAPINTIASSRCPVLLVHGTDDEVVPFGDALRLVEAGRAGTVQLISIQGGHDPTDRAGDYLQELIDFLKRTTNGPYLQHPCVVA